MADVLSPVPNPTVARYLAPAVHVTPVTEVVPTEPIPGRSHPGHYQHVLLNTITGELSFHEGTQHREPWNPKWRSVTDVPRDILDRWYPGKGFATKGPHMWFEPVPELLAWTIDSGHEKLPYLDVAAANALLDKVLPYAIQLVDGLFEASGDLDWSADSAHAGRNITRLTRRDPQVADREVDRDLVDYATIVQRFPQTFHARILCKPLGDLAEACESMTRFLGCNENWHDEIMPVFGVPFRDGSGRGVEVLGVRAWYRTALLAGDPRTPRDFADWDARLGRLAASDISPRSSDAELDAWAAREIDRATQANVLLLGARDAAEAHRAKLRDEMWDRLAVVGADVARLERELTEARSWRTDIVRTVLCWNDSDAAIGERGRMSRQAVHTIRSSE